MDYLRIMLQTLRERQLYDKFNKGEFQLGKVEFITYVVSNERIKVDPKKTESMENQPRQLTPSGIRSFFGLVGYYRWFVKQFSSISSPLTMLTQKKVKFMYTNECKKSFQTLKYQLTLALILTLLEGIEGLVVYCETSWVGLGYFLMQHRKYIAYNSRQLKVHERNNPTHNLTSPAIIFALKIWFYYQYGVHIDVLNDHKSLQHMFTKKYLNLRLIRLLELLQDYDMTVKYHLDKANVVAMGSVSHLDDEKKGVDKGIPYVRQIGGEIQ